MLKYLLYFRIKKVVGKEKARDFFNEIYMVEKNVQKDKLEFKRKEKQREEMILKYLNREKAIINSNIPYEYKKSAIESNTNSYLSNMINKKSSKIIQIDFIDREKIYQIKKQINRKVHSEEIIANKGKCIFCNKKLKSPLVNFEVDIENNLLIDIIKYYIKINPIKAKFSELECIINKLK